MSRRGDAAWKIPFCNPLGAAMINHEATEGFSPKMRVIYTYLGISSQALLRKYFTGMAILRTMIVLFLDHQRSL